jgi:hypothetical protein
MGYTKLESDTLFVTRKDGSLFLGSMDIIVLATGINGIIRFIGKSDVVK